MTVLSGFLIGSRGLPLAGHVPARWRESRRAAYSVRRAPAVQTCASRARRSEVRWWLVSVGARAATLLVAFLAVAGLVVFVVVHILLAEPPTVDFTAGHAAGQPVSMTIMTDPVNDVSDHPDWVSYFVRSPQTGKWIHSTIWQLPAHTRINVTAYEFDTCDPLRNQFNGLVTGTVGGVMSVSGEAARRQRQGDLGRQLRHHVRRRPHLQRPGARPQRPVRRRPVHGEEPVHAGTMHACRTPTRRPRSASSPPGPATTAGSASFPAAWPAWTATGTPMSTHRLHDRLPGRGGLMAATPQAAAPAAGPAEPNHGLRIFADLAAAGPGRRPGHLVRVGTAPAAGRHVQSSAAEPAVRHQGDGGDGRPGHAVRAHLLRVRLLTWRTSATGTRRTARPSRGTPGSSSPGSPITTVIVLALFVFGTVELVVAGRRGRRRGTLADLEARREAAGGPGDRPAVAVHLPLSRSTAASRRPSWCCPSARTSSSTSRRWT